MAAIVKYMEENDQQYDDLITSELKTIVTFIFQATQKSGSSKHTGKKSTCLEFLADFSRDQLADLVMTHLSTTTSNMQQHAETLNAVIIDAASQPLMIENVASKLTLDIELPHGLSVLGGPPSWLEEALHENSTKSS